MASPSPDPRGSEQLGVVQGRGRRSSSVSILDGRPMPPDSCHRPKVTWAKGVEFLEHDLSIVIKTVNGRRVSQHPLLQGKEPEAPKPGILFTTGQKVEMYNPQTDKWTIARVRGKVRRRDGWHYALRANHKDLSEHVPMTLLRPVKEYNIAEDHHLVRHMGWKHFKKLFDIPGRGLFKSNKQLKELMKSETCPFSDATMDGEDDWEKSQSFGARYHVDNPKSLKRVHHRHRRGRGNQNSAGKYCCLALTIIIAILGIGFLLLYFEVITIKDEGNPRKRKRRKLALLEELQREIASVVLVEPIDARYNGYPDLGMLSYR